MKKTKANILGFVAPTQVWQPRKRALLIGICKTARDKSEFKDLDGPKYDVPAFKHLLMSKSFALLEILESTLFTRSIQIRRGEHYRNARRGSRVS